MNKTITVKGPNGTFNGVIRVTPKLILKSTKNAGTSGARKVEVYDVETFINGSLFGEASKNLADAAITEVEVIRHEGLLNAHLAKLANSEIGKTVKQRMIDRGFEDEPREKLRNLNQWIMKHTRDVGIDNRRTAPRKRQPQIKRQKVA
jgi:hypothetical protein